MTIRALSVTLLVFAIAEVARSGIIMAPDPPAKVASVTPDSLRLISFRLRAEDPHPTPTVAQSTLQHSSSFRLIGAEDLVIMPCAEPAVLEPPVEKSSLVQPLPIVSIGDDFEDGPAKEVFCYSLGLRSVPEAGVYTGAVTLSIGGGAEASLPLTVHVSGDGAKIMGAICILAGVLAWWGFSVIAPYRGARARLASQFNALRAGYEELAAIRRRVADANAGIDLAAIGDRLERWRHSVSEERLNMIFPKSTVWPDPPDSSAVAEHLKQAAKEKNMLQALVTVGLENVEDWMDEPKRRAALLELDHLALTCRDPDAMWKAVDAILQTAADSSAFALLSGGVAQPPPVREKSTRVIEVEFPLGAWRLIVWVVVVTLGGVLALIANQPHFGTLTDQLSAFFWGLGVPSAGKTLMSEGPAKIKEALELKLPQ